MYLSYFGLKELPFRLNADERFYFHKKGFEDALSMLFMGISEADGFVKITGDVGTGKTYLCNKLRQSLASHFVTIYLNSPVSDEKALYFHLAKLLDLEIKESDSEHVVMDRIFTQIKSYVAKNKKVLLLIDEAQTMDESAMEALRLLNYRGNEIGALFHVVLFGQTELDWKLSHPMLRAMAQRIIFSYELTPMSFKEMEQYVAHRLSVVSKHNQHLFTKPALYALYYASKGIPRLVNVLCHKALLVSYREHRNKVTLGSMVEAVRNSQSTAVSAVRPIWGAQMNSQVMVFFATVCSVVAVGAFIKFI